MVRSLPPWIEPRPDCSPPTGPQFIQPQYCKMLGPRVEAQDDWVNCLPFGLQFEFRLPARAHFGRFVADLLKERFELALLQCGEKRGIVGPDP